ncbi:MAG: aminotransferase class IV [Planctomycetia bacterium]|nr:aminotransferase class IV [Planctomycetia bacterium]
MAIDPSLPRDRPLAYLSGQWLPAEQAAIPLSDAGFVLGTTVTERLRTFRGKLFRLPHHLVRLEHSLRIVGVEPHESSADLAECASELAAHNYALLPDGTDLGLSILITPGGYSAAGGVSERRPLVCLHTDSLPFRNWASAYESGVSLVITDIMQVPASCWPPELKCRSRMHYYLADRAAEMKQPGAKALLLNERGEVAETSIANIIALRKDEGLVTPPKNDVLPGITLGVVEELARNLGVPFHYRVMRLEDLLTAEEVLLASTPWCLLPVHALDGQTFSAKAPGPIFKKLLAAFNHEAGLQIAQQAKEMSQEIVG